MRGVIAPTSFAVAIRCTAPYVDATAECSLYRVRLRAVNDLSFLPYKSYVNLTEA